MDNGYGLTRLDHCEKPQHFLETYLNKTVHYLHVSVETVHAGDPGPDARYQLLLGGQHHLVQLPLPLSPGPVL